ncbi:MAG: hypothetical protein JNM14_07155 [Ferruginibacter sp.]|nr:hypothetical protein [Ferruginibacter sp.]
MKKVILTATFLMASIISIAQAKKIKVYLLGTFHFNQTDTLVYDVRNEKHQQSIKKLSDIVTGLKPDKVFIERMPEWENENRIDSLYQQYRKGALRKARNEIWQVGGRVAAALNHPHIYQCDHPGMYGYHYRQLADYANSHGQQDRLAFKGKGITMPLTSLVNDDSLKNAVDLLEYIRWFNSEKVQTSSHAHYINLYPQIGNTNVFNYDSTYFLGANLTIDWYRRNILIYAKILAQLDYTENAIFLIIGNDHVPIIRQMFRENPYFDVVNTEKWLGKSKVNIHAN